MNAREQVLQQYGRRAAGVSAAPDRLVVRLGCRSCKSSTMDAAGVLRCSLNGRAVLRGCAAFEYEPGTDEIEAGAA